MADYTVIATSISRGADEAELDVLTADFEVAAEAIGYARRMAEETFRLAAQLDLDFDYSNVSVFAGAVEADEAGDSHPDLVGMWWFADDGVDWVTAEALRAAGDEDEDGREAADGGPSVKAVG